jgi:hypothetical protein
MAARFQQRLAQAAARRGGAINEPQAQVLPV